MLKHRLIPWAAAAAVGALAVGSGVAAARDGGPRLQPVSSHGHPASGRAHPEDATRSTTTNATSAPTIAGPLTPPTTGDDHGVDDPATHDVGDDHGNDDPATHDVGDDHGNDDRSGRGGDASADDHSGRDGSGGDSGSGSSGDGHE